VLFLDEFTEFRRDAADQDPRAAAIPIWPPLRPLHDSLVAASSGHQLPNLGGDPWIVLRQTLVRLSA
jgi:hypothetical protein